MRVAVVGPGAIGTTVAAVLGERGKPVDLYGRTARDQLELRPDDGSPIVVPGPVHVDPETTREPADVIFLAAKATQTVEAAGWLKRLCVDHTVVCVLQNGVEHGERVAPLFRSGLLVPAIVWFPAEMQPQGWVRLRGQPRLSLSAQLGATTIVDLFAGTRCGVEIDADFVSSAWRKLLQNAAAGLMALTGRRAGVFGRDDLAQLAERYLIECLAVARADGAELPDDLPQQLVGQFRRFPVDMGTSILADRLAGRPLEWDLRNGVVLRKARQHGIPAPISEVLVPLLAATSDGPG
jgi:2-dehydropantoate 2-reductase